MNLSNPKLRFLFAAVIMAACLTILFSAQQAKAESPYIQNVFFGQDEQGDYISFDWVGIPPPDDQVAGWLKPSSQDIILIWLNRSNPYGTTTGMTLPSEQYPDSVIGDFTPKVANGGTADTYSGFGHGFASGNPYGYSSYYGQPALGQVLPQHFKTYINPGFSPWRTSFSNKDFLTFQIVQSIPTMIGGYIKLAASDDSQYFYQAPTNPLPTIPYTNVKFGFDENTLLKVSFDWVGLSRWVNLAVGLNGAVSYTPWGAGFTSDAARDISMTWERGVNLNLGYVDSLTDAFLEQGKHYDLPIIEMERWTPNWGLQVSFDCGSWWWICSNPIRKDALESFLGRSFKPDDYITIAFRSQSPSIPYPIAYDFNDSNRYYFAATTTVPNQPPTLSGLEQFDGVMSLSEGWVLQHPYISSFSANVSDPDGDLIRLQVELRRFEEPFTGIDDGGIFISDPVPSDNVARVPEIRDGVRLPIPLSDGKYHWRARAIDSNGNKSGWQEFGVVGNVDFEIKDVDTDGDCLGDSREETLGTNINNPDTDFDGLFDGWEVANLDMENNCQQLELDLVGLGPNPLHKDIFLEIDWMDCGIAGSDCAEEDNHNHILKDGAKNKVIEAFANAPVPNPDGVSGIALHIDVSNSVIHHEAINFDAGILGLLPSGFDKIKRDNFDDRRKRFYHYALFGHNFSILGLDYLNSGIAERPGNDFMVTLGDFTDQVGSLSEQAGTLMHELGHNLNLSHGGDEAFDPFSLYNYKPNYLSVMNYHFQVGGIRNTDGDTRFDYSGEILPTLDERNLNETHGIQDDNDITYYFCQASDLKKVLFGNEAADWDCDGNNTEENISTDINSSLLNMKTQLRGFNDWNSLVYRFQDTIDFLDGIRENTVNPEVELDSKTVETLSLDYEPYQVNIDIRPDSNTNPVNLKSKGVLPVVIFGSEKFNASTILIDSVALFGSTDKNHNYFEDINNDGFMDLILHFSIPSLISLTPNSKFGEISGKTTEKLLFVGRDKISIVPSK